jgi:hypothetical protein
VQFLGGRVVLEKYLCLPLYLLPLLFACVADCGIGPVGGRLKLEEGKEDAEKVKVLALDGFWEKPEAIDELLSELGVGSDGLLIEVEDGDRAECPLEGRKKVL